MAPSGLPSRASTARIFVAGFEKTLLRWGRTARHLPWATRRGPGLRIRRSIRVAGGRRRSGRRTRRCGTGSARSSAGYAGRRRRSGSGSRSIGLCAASRLHAGYRRRRGRRCSTLRRGWSRLRLRSRWRALRLGRRWRALCLRGLSRRIGGSCGRRSDRCGRS